MKLKPLLMLAIGMAGGALVLTGCQHCEECAKGHAAGHTRAYPLSTCIVSGEPLGATPVSYVHQGQQVKFCCSDCQKDFVKTPTKFLAKLPH